MIRIVFLGFIFMMFASLGNSSDCPNVAPSWLQIVDVEINDGRRQTRSEKRIGIFVSSTTLFVPTTPGEKLIRKVSYGANNEAHTKFTRCKGDYFQAFVLQKPISLSGTVTSNKMCLIDGDMYYAAATIDRGKIKLQWATCFDNPGHGLGCWGKGGRKLTASVKPGSPMFSYPAQATNAKNLGYNLRGFVTDTPLGNVHLIYGISESIMRKAAGSGLSTCFPCRLHNVARIRSVNLKVQYADVTKTEKHILTFTAHNIFFLRVIPGAKKLIWPKHWLVIKFKQHCSDKNYNTYSMSDILDRVTRNIHPLCPISGNTEYMAAMIDTYTQTYKIVYEDISCVELVTNGQHSLGCNPIGHGNSLFNAFYGSVILEYNKQRKDGFNSVYGYITEYKSGIRKQEWRVASAAAVKKKIVGGWWHTNKCE